MESRRKFIFLILFAIAILSSCYFTRDRNILVIPENLWQHTYVPRHTVWESLLYNVTDFPTKARYESQSPSSMEDELDDIPDPAMTSIRCKEKYIGCFVPDGSLKKSYRQVELGYSAGNDIKMQCLDKCYSSGGLYAGLRNKSCLCGEKAAGFISVEAWDLALACKSLKSYDIYMKVRKCEKEMSSSTMEKDLLGCLDSKPQLKGVMVALKVSAGALDVAQRCILSCERRGFTIAVASQSRQLCICSDFISLFEKAENVKKMSNNCISGDTSDRILIYATFNEDPSCRVRFYNQNEGKRIILFSFPGSGNTWIRHLMDISMGVYTGSVYNDMSLYNRGLLGETTNPYSGRSIAVKDHNLAKILPNKLLSKYQGAIAVIRNPYHAFLAEFARESTQSHTGAPSEASYKSRGFLQFAEQSSIRWRTTLEDVLTAVDPALVIYYENLVEDQVKEMRRIAEFLKLNSDDHRSNFERRLICMQLDVAGSFKRRKKTLPFDPFTVSLKEKYDNAIIKTNTFLLDRKHPSMVLSYLSNSTAAEGD